MISEFWITSRVGPENRRSRPRSMVTLATTATSSRMVAALIIRKVWTTSRVGSIGVRPVSTTKVRKADSSAIATANGANQRWNEKLLRSASDGSNGAAGVSALVILE